MLSLHDVAVRLGELNGWVLEGNAIQKEYSFADFRQALTFVNAVGELAEQQNHHPDIMLRYNRVILTLSTHSAGGLTEKDFELARAIDAR